MVRKDLVNTFVLKQDCLKVTLTTLLCKIYQTAPKLSAKEQDAARQTHASPSHDLKAGNGVPNDADQLKNSQKLTSPDPKVVASAVALHHFLAALLQPVCTALL